MRSGRIFTLVACVLLAGCERAVPPAYELSAHVKALTADDIKDPDALRRKIDEQLVKQCGTPLEPKLIGAPQKSADHLAHGAEVYRLRCAACHGSTGYGEQSHDAEGQSSPASAASSASAASAASIGGPP